MTGTRLRAAPRSRRWRYAAASVALLGCVATIGWLLPQHTVDAQVAEPARFLLAVALILVVCHAVGSLAVVLHQPRVVGEIAGGLLLGPSLLGVLWSGGQDWLFPPEVVVAVERCALVGLAMFMFLLGAELRVTSSRGLRTTLTLTTAGAMAVPFLAGLGIAWAGNGLIGGSDRGTLGSVVFFGLALSITALPVLARILTDLGLLRTPLGTLALTSAAIGDGVVWAGLAVLLASVGVGDADDAVTTAALGVALLAATICGFRPALRVLIRRVELRDAGTGLVLPVLVAGMLGFAAITQLIGLHPAIGAFLFGVALPRDSRAVAHIHRQLMGFTTLILLPLFFAVVGLQISFDLLLTSPVAVLLAVVVLVAAVGGKLGGCLAGGRLAGLPTRQALRLGALMNCRGVTELVVASIGLTYQLISPLGFTLLVLTALITTATCGPLLRLITAGEPAREPQPVEAGRRPALDRTG